MPIVDIVQRSEKWHVWRSQGITASMIPVIMGLSSYQTPYELWAEMVGFKERDDLSANWHVQRGIAQEPEARDAVEEQYGKPYMPVCVEADHNSLFRASLDGLYKLGDDKEVLEVKCPSEKIYNEVLELKGNSPTFKMYAAQVQWQLNTSGANTGRLYFYVRGKRPISIAIKRNDGFIAKAEEAAIDFWNLVQTKQPPEMIEGRDSVVYDTPVTQCDPTWLARVNQYKEKKARLAAIEAQVKAIKADTKDLESYFTSQIPDNAKTFDRDGIRATKVERNGNLDYKSLLADLASELNVVVPQSLIDKHTKEGSEYYRISLSNNDDSANPTLDVVESEKPTVNADLDVQNEQSESAPQSNPSVEAVETTVSAASVQTEPQKTQPLPQLPAANFHEKSTQSVFF